MFDPQLAGYWGSTDLDRATEAFVEIVRANAPKSTGVKISLLDAGREVELRRRLPAGFACTPATTSTTGVDRGDGSITATRLLGIFATPIARRARAALSALDEAIVRATRHFRATVPCRGPVRGPTYAYKRGSCSSPTQRFQSHFRMLGGAESARSVCTLRASWNSRSAGLIVDQEAPRAGRASVRHGGIV